ncbi:MAG: hypothetical protein NW208_13850 [Bryobacter sp.]|nr:hypothetical protein [Bryobacter sp.]
MPNANSSPAFNYFNYFTEIEERFQKARGKALFLMSPVDWALVETWKEQGIPLEAVLRGIDDAFDKWRQKKSKTTQVNSLAYCAQAVMEAARRIQDPAAAPASAPTLLSAEELEARLREAASQIPAEFPTIRDALLTLATEAASWLDRLEELEQNLSALSDKLLASLRAETSEADLLRCRQSVDAQLKPYRSKLSAADLMLMEKKFLDKMLLDHRRAPRLSLYYWIS